MVVTLLQSCHDLLGLAVVVPAKSELWSYEAKTSSANEEKDASLPQYQMARAPAEQDVCWHVSEWW